MLLHNVQTVGLIVFQNVSGRRGRLRHGVERAVFERALIPDRHRAAETQGERRVAGHTTPTRKQEAK